MAHTVQRVLVVKTGSLLAEGVESLLSEEPNLHVAAITPRSEKALLEEIKRARPDVIVLDEVSSMINVARLLALFEDHPELRVVSLRADDSRAHIYGKQQVSVTQLSDLVSLIQRGWNHLTGEAPK